MLRQGMLVNDMRYLASVVTQCFTAFGELLALHKRFAELTGGITRWLFTPPESSLVLTCRQRSAHLLCEPAGSYEAAVTLSYVQEALRMP